MKFYGLSESQIKELEIINENEVRKIFGLDREFYDISYSNASEKLTITHSDEDFIVTQEHIEKLKGLIKCKEVRFTSSEDCFCYGYECGIMPHDYSFEFTFHD